MASGTDILTYVGIPLALLGIFPLLWNSIVSVVIWMRLRRSLPPHARRFFKFTIDPVGGAVTCSYYEAEIIYGYLREGIEKMTIPAVQSGISAVNEHWLAATWMSLLCVEGLIPAAGPKYPLLFRVQLAMETKLVGLKCDWSTFVYIALAMGVPATDKGLLELRNSSNATRHPTSASVLRSDSGKEIFTATYSSSPVARIAANCFSFSLRRALAWDLVMVPLSARSPVPLLEANRSEQGFLSVPPALQDNSQREFGTVGTFVTLAASLTWALYTEEIIHHPDITQRELLPVPQDVIECRKISIDRLRDLGDFEDRLGKIFPGREETISLVAKTIQSGVILRVDIWEILQESTTFKTIVSRFGPHLSPSQRAQNSDELDGRTTDVRLLAEVILVTSAIQEWRGAQWIRVPDPYDGREVHVNPTAALFQEGDHCPPSYVFLG